jgi:hypothetical protein
VKGQGAKGREIPLSNDHEFPFSSCKSNFNKRSIEEALLFAHSKELP